MENKQCQPYTHGFSLIEVLVALVVLSIGMLGIAALFAETLRASRSAVYRLQAVNLATDMAECIRANRTAADDLARWQASIRSTLPGSGSTPSGSVTVDTAALPVRYTIVIAWSEPGQAGDLSYALDMRI